MEALNKKLFRLNSKEKIQKSTGTFVPDLPNGSFLKENGSMELLNDYFFKNKDIYISKHNRFADYPYHTHQFLELNYMYSGSSEQVIEGNKETLHEGELLLLDSGCHHSIKATGEKDILINILFRDQQISLEWLTSIKKKNKPSIRLSSSFQRKRAIFKEIYYFSKCANSAYPTNFKPNYHRIFFRRRIFIKNYHSLFANSVH